MASTTAADTNDQVIPQLAAAIVAKSAAELKLSESQSTHLASLFENLALTPNAINELIQAVSKKGAILVRVPDEDFDKMPESVPRPRGPADYFVLSGSAGAEQQYVVVADGSPYLMFAPKTGAPAAPAAPASAAAPAPRDSTTTAAADVTGDELNAVLTAQKGVLFLAPCLVCRVMYCGRDIIAKNSDVQKYGDDRGYVPVERWVVSKTVAGNEIPKPNEGLSLLLLPGGKQIIFRDAADRFEQELMGSAENNKLWPLIKVLDIGGNPVQPQFKTDAKPPAEIPPIPCHVHSGNVVNGRIVGPGKLEAYFFPPLDGVPPYNRKLDDVKSRLGFLPGTTQEQVLAALKGWGEHDDMYRLMNVWEVHENEGWTIPTGVVHAPGPWPTVEIQRAQDDFNLLCWKLGHQLPGHSCGHMKNTLALRGLASDEVLLKEAVDWTKSCSQTFKQDNFRPAEVLSSGAWGRQIRIFWDNFYGEGWEVNAGQQWTRPKENRPLAALVWSGKGTVNGNTIDIDTPAQTEFFVVPNTEVTVVAQQKLYIYAFFPMLKP